METTKTDPWWMIPGAKDPTSYGYYIGEVEIAVIKLEGSQYHIYHNAVLVEPTQFRDTLQECHNFILHLVPKECRFYIKRCVYGNKKPEKFLNNF